MPIRRAICRLLSASSSGSLMERAVMVVSEYEIEYQE
jgi:hypothetical protein